MGKTSYRERHGSVREKPGKIRAGDAIPFAQPVVDTLSKNGEKKQDDYLNVLKNTAIILNQYPTHMDFDVGFDINAAWLDAIPAIQAAGYTPVDVTDDLAHLAHPAHVCTKHAQLVHQARTTKDFIFIRRTVENTPFVLITQFIEHARGQVAETTPLAYMAIVREDQMLVTRDQASKSLVMTRLLSSMASNVDVCPVCSLPLRLSQSTVLSCGHGCHSACYATLVDGATANDTCPNSNKVFVTCPTCTAENEDGSTGVVAQNDAPGSTVSPIQQLFIDHSLQRVATKSAHGASFSSNRSIDEDIKHQEDRLVETMRDLAALVDLERESRPASLSDEELHQMILDCDKMMSDIGLPTVSSMTTNAKKLKLISP